MVKDKPYLCKCDKWVLSQKLSKDLRHNTVSSSKLVDSFLFFFVFFFCFFFFSFSEMFVFFRSTIGYLDRLSP